MRARKVANSASAMPLGPLIPGGTQAVSKPSLADSLSRSGAWATGRTSPDKAISPITTHSLGTGRSANAEIKAAYARAKASKSYDRVERWHGICFAKAP